VNIVYIEKFIKIYIKKYTKIHLFLIIYSRFSPKKRKTPRRRFELLRSECPTSFPGLLVSC